MSNIAGEIFGEYISSNIHVFHYIIYTNFHIIYVIIVLLVIFVNISAYNVV